MNPDELKRGYQAFFLNTDAGKEFYKELHEIIERNHVKAENDPDHARDFVQQSKGVRDIINHIKVLSEEGIPKS